MKTNKIEKGETNMKTMENKKQKLQNEIGEIEKEIIKMKKEEKKMEKEGTNLRAMKGNRNELCEKCALEPSESVCFPFWKTLCEKCSTERFEMGMKLGYAIYNKKMEKQGKLHELRNIELEEKNPLNKLSEEEIDKYYKENDFCDRCNNIFEENEEQFEHSKGSYCHSCWMGCPEQVYLEKQESELS